MIFFEPGLDRRQDEAVFYGALHDVSMEDLLRHLPIVSIYLLLPRHAQIDPR